MANLYQLGTDFLNIEQNLIDNGGEITEDLEKLLNENSEAINVKLTSIVYIILNAINSQLVIEKEIERLTKRKKVFQNLENKLNNYVKMNMERLGISDLKTDLVDINIRRNPLSVFIIDESCLSKKFFTKKTTQVIDKKAIKQAIESGAKVKGAELVRSTSLVIK